MPPNEVAARISLISPFSQLALLALFGLSFWWAVSCTLAKAKQQRKGVAGLEKKQQLHCVQLNRSIQLAGGIVYVSALTYCHLIVNPAALSAGQVLGLLLAYCTVAAICWSMTLAVVPQFEAILLNYNTILSAAIYSVAFLSTNYAHANEAFTPGAYYDKLMAYNIYWLMEDVEVGTYLPMIFISSAMHLTAQLQGQPDLWAQPMQLLAIVCVYVLLGLAVPLLLSLLSSTCGPVPGTFFMILSSSGNMYYLLDLLLRTPSIVEPLLAGSNSSVLRSVLSHVMASPEPGRNHGYGLAPSAGLQGLSLIFLLTYLCSFALSLSDGEPPVGDGRRAKIMQALYQNPAAVSVLSFMHSLPPGKKYAVCSMVCVSALQFMGILNIVMHLILYGTEGFVSCAPSVLLSIMLGVILEVFGVLYIVVPTPAPEANNDTAQGLPDSLRTLSITSASQRNVLGQSKDTRDTGSSDLMSMISGVTSTGARLTEDVIDFSSRIESLANFKTFMSGLDHQPGVYSLDEFIKGAATAMKGIFPGVHHASFCLLNSSRSSVNMYTFLGEGSQKPPRINVAVAPGTLIFHVLHNCQPIFISDINTFPGPYSDVQFMRFVLGLRSVACLPLVVAGLRILGVLRLGFEEPRQWDEQEKSIAKQVALVLSSSHHSIGSNPPPSMDVMGRQTSLQSGGAGGAANSDSLALSYQQQQQMLASGSGQHYNPAAGPNSGGANSLIFSGSMAGSGSQANARSRRSFSQMHQDSTGSASGHSQHSQPQYLAPAEAGSSWGYGPGLQQRGPPGRSSIEGSTAEARFMRSSSNSPGEHALASRNTGSASRDWSHSSAYDEFGTNSSGALGRRMPDHLQQNADLKMFEVIGRGGYGSVYKAFWRGMVVAVKVLEHGDDFVGCADEKAENRQLDTMGRRAALLEGAMTSTINHPNVCATFDYRVVHLDPQPTGSTSSTMMMNRVLQETQIIMEYCDRGSLQDAIEQGFFFVDGPEGVRGKGKEPAVDMELIIMTLAEVSTAMEYLHQHRITHRDLKPKNILLKTSSKDRRGFVAKVSDFGLSQVLPDTNRTQVSTKYSGTVTHMPPELIEDGKVYPQGDVYAFGIILYEIYTGNNPYSNMAHPQIMVGVVTHNLRPKFPESTPEWYRAMANKCWRKDPKARPSFKDLTRYLMQMLKDKSWASADGPGSGGSGGSRAEAQRVSQSGLGAAL